jgi:hypothetical protein
MHKFGCPECGFLVSVDLDYDTNIQHTTCPNGHKLWRMWNGPERPDWDRETEPYGWSDWQLA